MTDSKMDTGVVSCDQEMTSFSNVPKDELHTFTIHPNFKFTVPRRYSLVKALGNGAYGVVCACRDEITNQQVAIKKISRIFEKKIMTKRVLREIKLLRHFQNHENIIAIQDIIAPYSMDFEEIYLVQPLMEADMHQILRSGQPLTDAHFQYFIYQILRGLKFIHSANVMHRDLKPGNLLVNSDCEIKICDFGLARGISSDPDSHAGFMTEYVATRWYRAPEIMLSFRHYTKAIDMWSVGCIFAEMLSRKVLFQGRDYVHQLNLILNILGTPNDEQLARIGSPRARDYIRSLPHTSKVPFSDIIPNASAEALDLLERMLDFDPMTRMTVDEALHHPYLKQYHDETDEPTAPLFDFHFESIEDLDSLKSCIVEEIDTYHSGYKQYYVNEIAQKKQQQQFSSMAMTDIAGDVKETEKEDGKDDSYFKYETNTVSNELEDELKMRENMFSGQRTA